MSFRRFGPLVAFLAASALAFACGGANDTDFDSDDGSAGDSSGEGGTSGGGTGQGGSAGTASGSGGSSQGGSSQGGSSQGGSSQGGSSQGGSSQGGNDPTGGSSGNTSGGASGTATGGGNTGGAAGTDGGAGSGGTGPGGSGGTSGRAGGGGTGGNECAAIIASAQAALLAAQVCNPAQSSPICTGSVEDLCGCTVPVNQPESTATKSYLAQREAAVRCGVPCLAIVCPEPTTPMCGISALTNRIVAQAHCVYSPR